MSEEKMFNTESKYCRLASNRRIALSFADVMIGFLILYVLLNMAIQNIASNIRIA